MRAPLLLLLLLSGCGGSSDEDAPTLPPPRPDDRMPNALALPITTPVGVGRHMVNELDRQQAERDRRNADLESLLQQRDR